jgi:hypothetical protein
LETRDGAAQVRTAPRSWATAKPVFAASFTEALFDLNAHCRKAKRSSCGDENQVSALGQNEVMSHGTDFRDCPIAT